MEQRVNDQEKWEQAVALLLSEYNELPTVVRHSVDHASLVLRGAKLAMHCFVENVGAGSVCAACQGECCVRGSSHVTVVDLLVLFASGWPVMTPVFDRHLCPYLGEAGCQMEVEFRPFNCVTFNCERVEGLLDPGAIKNFYEMERELRRCYSFFEQLLGNRFMHGLLVNYDRDILLNRGSFINVKQVSLGGGDGGGQ
jgi:hypothetical protein